MPGCKTAEREIDEESIGNHIWQAGDSTSSHRNLDAVEVNHEFDDRLNSNPNNGTNRNHSPDYDSAEYIYTNIAETRETVTNEHNYHEPLAYKDYLCDVNIEYNSGSNRSGNCINCKGSFKLKYLPYLMPVASLNISQADQYFSAVSNNIREEHQNDGGSSSNCSSSIFIDFPSSSPQLDVTKTTSAFLGDSEHVPISPNRRRRVVLELISAKLSQSTHYVSSVLPPTSTQVVKLTPLRRPSSSSSTPPQSPIPSSNNRSRLSFPILTPNRQLSRNSSQIDLSNSAPQSPQLVPSLSANPAPPAVSSKRFVNYTLLIRTLPGLDVHPTVIERRFSDFSSLYRGLKLHEPYGNLVDHQVDFPKKVYIGNYSLVNIAERSIEFAKLLNLCISEVDLQCSIPFVSFLLDKELREAHRLTMFGDPEDVQALIETVYNILLKLYLRDIQIAGPDGFASEMSILYNNTGPKQSISPTCHPSSPINGLGKNGGGHQSPLSPSQSAVLTPQKAITKPTSIGMTPPWLSRMSSTAINQRILATFAILFLNYSKTANHSQLREVARVFSILLEDSMFVASFNDERFLKLLKTCLNFILIIDPLHSNIGHGILDNRRRIFLDRKLSEIGSSHNGESQVNSNVSNGDSMQDDTNHVNGRLDLLSISGDSLDTSRAEFNLAALIRNKDFCSFQDGKFTNKR